nr:hypothetical protein [Tanacetum cinerariifolium]
MAIKINETTLMWCYAVSLADAIQYLTFSPDITYAVQQLYASSTSQLIAYSDADWVGAHLHAEYRGVANVVAETAWLSNVLLELHSALHSATLVCCDNVSVVYLSSNPVQRQRTKHIEIDIHFVRDQVSTGHVRVLHVPSRFHVEAEYRGVANVVAETAWLRNVLLELHSALHSATLVYCDNVSAVYLSSNPVQRQRTKHIEIEIHFVRDQVSTGHVRVLHVPSRFQYANIFTKGLPSLLFNQFRSSLNVRASPAQTEGVY